MIGKNQLTCGLKSSNYTRLYLHCGNSSSTLFCSPSSSSSRAATRFSNSLETAETCFWSRSLSLFSRSIVLSARPRFSWLTWQDGAGTDNTNQTSLFRYNPSIRILIYVFFEEKQWSDFIIFKKRSMSSNSLRQLNSWCSKSSCLCNTKSSVRSDFRHVIHFNVYPESFPNNKQLSPSFPRGDETLCP